MGKQVYQLELKEDSGTEAAYELLTAIQPALHKTYRGSDLIIKGETPKLIVYSDKDPVPELPEGIRSGLSGFWEIRKVD